MPRRSKMSRWMRKPSMSTVPAFPICPDLIIEGLAQLGGILVSEHFDFRKRVVLAKVGQGGVLSHPRRRETNCATMPSWTASRTTGRWSPAPATSTDRPRRKSHLMFAFLDDERFGQHTLFAPGRLAGDAALMRFFRCRRGCLRDNRCRSRSSDSNRPYGRFPRLSPTFYWKPNRSCPAAASSSLVSA